MKFNLALLLAICFSNLYGQIDSIWTFYEERDGIKIFYKTHPESEFKELKLVTESSASRFQYVNELTTIDSFPTWAFNCTKAEVVKRISDYDFYYYFLSDAPWPMDDRDMVIHMRVSAPDTLGRIIINTNAHPGLVPVYKQVVRVPYMVGQWIFSPLNSGKTEIQYSITMDPGGAIPVWLINYAMDIGPVKTMNAIKNRVENLR